MPVEEVKRRRPKPPAVTAPAAAPASPVAPPAPSDEEQVAAWKGLDLNSPKICREVAADLSGQFANLYELWALAKNDQRYCLADIEKDSQARAMSIGLMALGDAAKPWLIPVVILMGLGGPVIARLFFMPEKPDDGTVPAPDTKKGKKAA